MTCPDHEREWDFDDHADGYDEAMASDSKLFAPYKQILSAVIETAEVGKGDLVLDIGTGTGALALRCLSREARVVGMDPSRKMLARARDKIGANPGVELLLVKQPFLGIPAEDACFDAVVSTYAFHHVSDRLKPRAVVEMSRVLKPGGRLVIGDISFATRAIMESSVQAHDWLDDEYYLVIDELRPQFEDSGLRLQTRRYADVHWVLWGKKI